MTNRPNCRFALPRRPLALAALLSSFAWTAALPEFVSAEEKEVAIERRLADAAQYLSSDELEGRAAGTEGLDLAADYVARQFRQTGLNTDLFDGQPFQGFQVALAAEVGPENKLVLVGPPGADGQQPETIELKLGEDFSPLSASGSGDFDLPLVFAGYGITGQTEGYDDYAGVDVQGKVAVILRHEPQQADPNSVFNGNKHSAHAPFQRKVSNASEHGVGGLIFCTDQFEIRKNVSGQRKKWQEALDQLAARHEEFKAVENPTLEQIEAQRAQIQQLTGQVQELGERLGAECDPLMRFGSTGRNTSRSFPVIHCRRGALDRVVAAALGTDLARLEAQIDEGPTPHSRALDGWRVVGRTDVRRKQAEVKNVVAVLEAEGPTAEETIVLGAHYDHVGFGRPRSSDAKQQAVCNGADDNASGVAVLIEVARSLAGRPEKLRRRVVFVAFAAEERGLLGSAHYVNHPPVPLENTVVMLNLDMVGRLRDDKLTIGGTGTSGGFADLVERIGQEHGLKLTKRPSGFGPSDHASFYRKKIPAMHFFTGTHADLHRPTDDFEKLNVPGMRRVCRMVEDVVVALANAPQRPEYVATGSPPRRGGGGRRAVLGTVPDFSAEAGGYALGEVVPGGPAEKAGLRAGDVIVQFGQGKIDNLDDVDAALRKHQGGDRVQVVVRRGDETLSVEVTLGTR